MCKRDAVRALAFLLFAGVVFAAADRAQQLERVLLAPCCYKEPISRHHSEAALRMKLEVAAWVAEGKPDEEILGIYRERYGARVVVPPEPEPSPWIRNLPWLAAAAGGAAVIRILAKWRRPEERAGEMPVA